MYKFNGLLLILALVGLLLGMPISQVFAADGVMLTKVASSENATLGDTIIYTYTITNNTMDNCFEAKLVDNKIGEIDIPDQLLAGDNFTATASYVVSLSDYSDNATELVNTATFTSGENITATTTESVALNLYRAALQVTKVADKSVATLADVITYTYNVINNGVVEIKDISLNDNKLGPIALRSDNITVTSLAPGEIITATASYKMVFADVLAGAIKNTATVTGIDPGGRPVSASSGEITVSANVIKSLLTKAEVLKLSGVPGKGIDKAPGLQKPFNPKSQASEHAGKKDIKRNMQTVNNQGMNSNSEQNREQEMNENNGKNNGKGNGHGNNNN